jgi:hypothetical protein
LKKDVDAPEQVSAITQVAHGRYKTH